MKTKLNSPAQTASAKSTGCLLVTPDNVGASIAAVGSLRCKECHAPRAKGRGVLIAIAMAVISLLQTGCVSVSDDVCLTTYVGALVGLGPEAWRSKPLEVRVKRALGPATSASILKDMGQDAELVTCLLNEVRTYDQEKADRWQQVMNALKRMQLSPQTYSELYLGRNAYLRCVVACNHYSPPDLLEALAKDEDEAIRQNVAGNPATPVAVLESLHQDSRAKVVEWVNNNPAWQQHIPGTPHDKYPNVVWAENGEFHPANGYCWVDPNDPNDFRVQLRPTTWTYTPPRIPRLSPPPDYWSRQAQEQQQQNIQQSRLFDQKYRAIYKEINSMFPRH